jgi:hypothetical protein
MDDRPKTRRVDREPTPSPSQPPRGSKQIVIPMTRPQYDEIWHCARKAQERRMRLETRKPFIGTLRVNESRPAEPGRQPEASLAWGGATLTAKRRQRVPRPCD